MPGIPIAADLAYLVAAVAGDMLLWLLALLVILSVVLVARDNLAQRTI